jgi:tetratricopeptide (TPR) repeat protein
VSRTAATWWVPGLLALAAPSMACINTFVSEIQELKAAGDEQRVAKVVASTEASYRQTPTLETTNDLAVAWILTGRMPEGIQLLRELEKQYPGNAIVAANLGTALELTGADDEALQWIRESVRRDPQEHQGSEWVHVRILEAKQALKKDPNWLRKNSVVGWREGQRLPPNERSQPRTPRNLIDSIDYQLNERTQFVNAPDALVGDLYLSLGDLAHSFPAAYGQTWERDGEISSNYHSAIHYGTVHEARARERMAAADKRIEAARPAMLAAAKLEQEARAREEQRSRQVEQRKADLKSAQERRRWLAVAAFGTFGTVVIGVIFLRRRRGEAKSA